MSAEPIRKLTPEEYLAFERQSEIKNEFWHGEIFAMAGASEAHNLIITNVIGELRGQLKGHSCKVYPNDMRVSIPRSRMYTYPDVTVVCGKAEFDDRMRDTLLNPTLIIEVLSPSTENYDRTEKFKSYRTIESLKEYVLISQKKPQIECYMRQKDTPFWIFSAVSELEAVAELTTIGCRLALSEVYENVEFDAQTAADIMPPSNVPR